MIVEPEDIRRKTGLASGDIMISFLGHKRWPCSRKWILLDSEFNVKGRYLFVY
jgi:hypothetical protein